MNVAAETPHSHGGVATADAENHRNSQQQGEQQSD